MVDDTDLTAQLDQLLARLRGSVCISPIAWPTTAAIRTRRYRERQRKGAMVFPVEVTANVREGLATYGFLATPDTTDRKEVAAALDRLLDAVITYAIEPSEQ